MVPQPNLNRNPIAATKAPDVAIIRCEGEMGDMELAQLGEELFRVTNRGYGKVVLDLSKVDHIDYRGVGPLAARARLLKRAGGGLSLTGVSAYLAAILRAAGVDEDFEMHRTIDDALVSFAQAPVLAMVRNRR
jgi:anti-anti-sigma factor